MTLANVASVGAGLCAAGHLPAPQDPEACALLLEPQRARPQLLQSILNCPPPQRFLFSERGRLGVGRASFIHSPPSYAACLKWGWGLAGGRGGGQMADGGQDIFFSPSNTSSPLTV